jgi:hypothetical protein
MTVGNLAITFGILMQLFRYSTSIYGGDNVLIGASWDLLKWFVIAGAAVILLHAVAAAVTSRRGGTS